MELPVLKTKKDRVWIDENGTNVPFITLTEVEKLKEKTAFGLAKEAMAINKKLVAFKERIAKDCGVIYDEVMKDSEREGKGSFTFYNFDYTIKVEVRINQNIGFDSLLIEKAKLKLEDFIGDVVNPQMEFAKELVMGAFQTSKGNLDTKSVLGLKKHSTRITDKRWHDAMALIDESVRRPSSKTYFVVSVKNESGEFENIDLNFSSI